MNQYAIEEYFHTTALTSFEGSLNSLALLIAKQTETNVTTHDLIEFFWHNNGLSNYEVNLFFTNGKTNISILEK